MYVYVIQCCFIPTPTHPSKHFPELLEKEGIQNCSYFLCPDSLYIILKLLLLRKIFPTIYNMPGSVIINFFAKTMSRDRLERWIKS